MTTRILIFLFLSQFVFAETTDSLCWTKEENPKTLKPYTSQAEWSVDLETWSRKQQPQFNVIQLIKAYGVYKKELPKAQTFPNDKMEHCFIGCRISQETNLKTARYVGWLKEDLDLTDCKLTTHFDPKDFTATLRGAEAGQNKKVKCEDVCPSLIETL